MMESFWRNKRVFVTGHTGFKGGWLTLWLKRNGATVCGYSLEPPTAPNLFSIAGIADGIESFHGDIRDFGSLNTAVDQFKPEIVFHLAAQPLVKRSYDDPVETYATNVLGTVHLLEVVRKAGCVRVVVNVTSDKCYENREWVWGYRETEPMGGYDPYSSSKGCAELVTSAFRNSFFNPRKYGEHGVALASVRAGNVIGGGDWAENRLVPDILRAMETQKPVVIRNPQAIRPWQHVLEPLSGYVALAERLWAGDPRFAEGWNFGPGDSDARSVEWIVEHMVALWGEGAQWVSDEREHAHEANYLKLDSSKAKTLLGWRQTWSLEEALARIVDWHKAYIGGENMREHCLREIQDFENAIGRRGNDVA